MSGSSSERNQICGPSGPNYIMENTHRLLINTYIMDIKEHQLSHQSCTLEVWLQTQGDCSDSRHDFSIFCFNMRICSENENKKIKQ